MKTVEVSHPLVRHKLGKLRDIGTDPVLFLEPKARYWDKGEVSESRVKAQLDAPGGASAASTLLVTLT